ncbi:MAG TPA: sugar kinase [Actinopolymorphaceae bacterium]
MSEGRPDVVTVGETMALVAFNDTGPVRVGSTGRLSIGGAESNVAIGLARLGHRSAWIGRVGDDAMGRLIESTLRGEGVDVSGVTHDPDVATGAMLREHRSFDRFRVDYYRKGLAGSRLAPEHLDPALVGSASIVHVTGISPAVSPTAGAAALRAMELAHRVGATVSFDVNHRSALWSSAQATSVLTDFTEASDIVFAGPEEAELVAGVEPGSVGVEGLVELLAQHGAQEVVIKNGVAGATGWLRDGDELVSVPARAVTCIDPVGAGDAFVAGYLSARLDGLGLAERLDRGTICGAFAVSVSGDWEGAPRRAELGFLSGVENVLR